MNYPITLCYLSSKLNQGCMHFLKHRLFDFSEILSLNIIKRVWNQQTLGHEEEWLNTHLPNNWTGNGGQHARHVRLIWIRAIFIYGMIKADCAWIWKNQSVAISITDSKTVRNNINLVRFGKVWFVIVSCTLMWRKFRACTVTYNNLVWYKIKIRSQLFLFLCKVNNFEML